MCTNGVTCVFVIFPPFFFPLFFLMQPLRVFMCSYMSVLNGCQEIYLLSAVGHVRLFSFSVLCVCVSAQNTHTHTPFCYCAWNIVRLPLFYIFAGGDGGTRPEVTPSPKLSQTLLQKTQAACVVPLRCAALYLNWRLKASGRRAFSARRVKKLFAFLMLCSAAELTFTFQSWRCFING